MNKTNNQQNPIEDNKQPDDGISTFGLLLGWLCVPAYAFNFWYYYGDSGGQRLTLLGLFTFLLMLITLAMSSMMADNQSPRRYLKAVIQCILELAILLFIASQLGLPLLITLCFVQAIIAGVMNGCGDSVPLPRDQFNDYYD